MRPTLFLFAKAPVIGGAKSRLAKEIGRVRAWRVYRSMTATLVRSICDARWETVMAIAPDRALDRRFPKVWPQALARTPQGGGDLGARQARVFRGRKGVRAKVCVIGTDAPQVRAADIASAFRALNWADAVIGPAEDGGYWLLALWAPAPAGVFAGVRWSSAQARADLEANLRAAGLARIKRLRTLRDIDEAADLKRA